MPNKWLFNLLFTLCFFLPLYHSSQTSQFVNTFTFEGHEFVLKLQLALIN
jgi:hypothetical protein